MQTLPQAGEQATVAGIAFPLTIESYDPNTRTASLKGEHPDSGVEVLLPRVCLDMLHAPNQFAKGDVVHLKSGGPKLILTSNPDSEGDCNLAIWNDTKAELEFWENMPVACLQKADI